MSGHSVVTMISFPAPRNFSYPMASQVLLDAIKELPPLREIDREEKNYFLAERNTIVEGTLLIAHDYRNGRWIYLVAVGIDPKHLVDFDCFRVVEVGTFPGEVQWQEGALCVSKEDWKSVRSDFYPPIPPVLSLIGKIESDSNDFFEIEKRANIMIAALQGEKL